MYLGEEAQEGLLAGGGESPVPHITQRSCCSRLRRALSATSTC